MKAEVFYSEDAERLYLAFLRAIMGERIESVSRGVHDGHPAVTVEWEEPRPECETIQRLMQHFDEVWKR
ncbi:MAG: hypothetical protein ABIJ47_01365 [Candidatus Bathyarchaeota archaeon]